jgi:hypothetical protein
MRFNHEDLRRGNVSVERIKEVVLHTMLKGNETLQQNPEALRYCYKLIHDFEKTLVHKSSEIHRKEETNEVLNYKKNLNNLKFFNKLIHSNLKLIQMESRFVAELRKKYKKALLARKAAREKEWEKLMQQAIENEEIIKLEDLKYQMMQEQLNEKNPSSQRLQELQGIKRNLENANKELEKVIIASRTHHAKEMVKHLDKHPEYDHLNPKQKEQLSHLVLKARENAIEQMHENDIKCEQELKHFDDKHLNKTNGNMLNSFNTQNHIKEREKIKEKYGDLNKLVKEQEKKVIRQIGDHFGVNEKGIEKLLKDEGINDCANKHGGVFKECHVEKIKNVDVIKKVDEEVKVINDTIDAKQEKKHDNEEKIDDKQEKFDELKEKIAFASDKTTKDVISNEMNSNSNDVDLVELNKETHETISKGIEEKILETNLKEEKTELTIEDVQSETDLDLSDLSVLENQDFPNISDLEKQPGLDLSDCALDDLENIDNFDFPDDLLTLNTQNEEDSEKNKNIKRNSI